MRLFSFGKNIKRKVSKKPPSSIIKKCKKLKIKITKKVGNRRVYKKLSVLKKLIKLKMKVRKSRKGKRKGGRIKRRFRFGSVDLSPDDFNQPKNYGYNNEVKQSPGVLSQSSMVVNNLNKNERPGDFKLDDSTGDVYGVYRPFFTEKVPTQIGPNSIGFMGQPDGSLYAVGGPFAGYTSFGKRRTRRRPRPGPSTRRRVVRRRN